MFFIKTTFCKAMRRTTCVLSVCLLLLCAVTVNAQQPQADTANKIKIIIANSGAFEYFKTDTGSFNKFVKDVILYQGTDTLYCDSLYQFVESKKLEAFGNVRVAQAGGTEATCDYLRYMSEKKLAYMQGNVTLVDGNNKLWCDELTYNLGTKVGVYNNKGTLKSDSTIVTSRYGVYNVNTHEARFTGNVLISDPEYNISSKDLGYNTETKVETFYDYSIVSSDSGRSILSTYRGTYDSKNVIARFTGHSSIWNDGEYIEADFMHYDKPTGYGYAIGNVISVDTANHTTMYCGRADYFRKKRILWATIKPVLELATGKDTFFMRADTFYSAPMIRVPGTPFRMPVDTTEDKIDSTSIAKLLKGKTPGADSVKKATDSTTTAKGRRTRARKPKVVLDTIATVTDTSTKVIDSMWVLPILKYRMADFIRDTARKPVVAKPVAAKPIKNKKKKTEPEPAIDTADADSTAPVFFSGYHHVLIYSDSMQARCDSVCVTRSDSIVHMLYNPVAWARGSQITGDTILMQLDSSSIRSMYVPENAFIVSRTGPEKAEIFDQVQGKTLTAYFKDNNIRKMIVYPDAESIYFSKDDDGAYVGVMQVTSVLMRVFFGEEKIKAIKYIQNVNETMTPMDKADLPNTRLSRFIWLYDQRPESREQLFR